MARNRKAHSQSKKPANPRASNHKEEEHSSDVESAITVVGIGASAGGLEAFMALLKDLPPDLQMAYVLIQHQDPHHVSALPQILRKSAAPMPVIEATDQVLVKPNHIYVIPSNSDLELSDGHLKVKPRSNSKGVHLPVDRFFQSLAEHMKSKAIGVVLSGTATDGTLGLKAIKAAGGITFAQDEKSAKYFGMPRSAIISEVVDFVLPPEEIAHEISMIAKQQHTILQKSQKETERQGVPTLTQMFALLHKSTGVDFTHYKPTTIMRRIHRRMLLHKMDTLEEYLKFLKDHPKNIDSLYEDILINVTSFFRDPEVFEVLKEDIFPKWTKVVAQNHAIRIWVPGCSSGEEAYSIAIALQEYLGDRKREMQVQIFATDISENAIEKARTGEYSQSIAADVSPERLRRFFTKTEHGYQVSKSIRDLCIFARHNMVKDPPFSRIDLISCRNLLIYLGPLLQRRVVPIFHYALNPNGALLLGSSESIGNFIEFFYPADKKYKIFSKKAIASKLHFDMPEMLPQQSISAIAGYNDGELEKNEKDVMREGDRLTLSRFAPAAVIVDDNLDIIQFRGKTGRFLEPSPGQASFNIVRMAREGLVGELRSGLLKARKDKLPVQKRGLIVHENGIDLEVTVDVEPFALPRSSQFFYLVFFETSEQASKIKRKPAPKVSEGKHDRELQRLRAELQDSKEYLQSVIEEHEASNEELRAANEEIMSSNEELQSTNEEMETAKEELQSANEELTTVNEELQVRNVELSYLNNDLNNLLASVSIPIVMLGNDLGIRRFTPMAERVLNLIPSDVGRPITDINLNIKVKDLSNKIIEVIDTMTIKELDIQDKTGNWYNLQIRPYKTLENKIDGAVLSFIDIASIRRNQQQNTSDSFRSILQTMAEPALLLNQAFIVRLANDAFLNAFNYKQKEIEDKNLFQLHADWADSGLKSFLESISTEKDMQQKTQLVELSIKKNKRKVYRVEASRMMSERGEIMFLMSMTPNRN